jgi:hypothetical protein
MAMVDALALRNEHVLALPLLPARALRLEDVVEHSRHALVQ